MRLPEGVTEVRGAERSRREYPHKDVTERIIGCAIAVHRELRAGYVEAVYENALAHELNKQGIGVERQKVLVVHYDGVPVGEHRADLLVEGKTVVELKAVSEFTDQHMAQIMSTMRAASVRVGLLINFAAARLVDGVKRVVM